MICISWYAYHCLNDQKTRSASQNAAQYRPFFCLLLFVK